MYEESVPYLMVQFVMFNDLRSTHSAVVIQFETLSEKLKYDAIDRSAIRTYTYYT